MEEILLWYGNQIKSVRKKDFKVDLCIKASEFRKAYEPYSRLRRKVMYVYAIIQDNIDKITCIQMYNDGVIRLHLKYGYFDTPKSIFIDDIELCANETFRDLMITLIN